MISFYDTIRQIKKDLGDKMSVSGIKRKQVTLSLSEVAYGSLIQLAQQEGVSVSEYSRRIIEREIIQKGLPLYYPAADIQKKTPKD